MKRNFEVNGTETTFSGIYISAPTKEIQKKLLEKSLIGKWLLIINDQIGNYSDKSYFEIPMLEIEMPCGKKVEYLTIFDVPTETTMCPCGNHNHYLLKFEIK